MSSGTEILASMDIDMQSSTAQKQHWEVIEQPEVLLLVPRTILEKEKPYHENLLHSVCLGILRLVLLLLR